VRRLVIAVIAVLALAGCGPGNPAFVKDAETEGTYVDVGGLTYQVQLSRYLNPADVEDREYLTGLPGTAKPQLGAGEIWFGVWMRVKNYSKETITPTTGFEITDTLNKQFIPVNLARSNPFAYNPIPLGHANVYPLPDSAASSGVIQGSLILFRLSTASIANRPLILHITSGSDEATVSLDL
jgi:hypothetical protein